ncbi:SorU family sulfite dehydrogenase c-type cytochrome subunit [Cupriavidus necator]
MPSYLKLAASAALAAIAAFAGSNALAQAGLEEGRKLFTQTAVPACAVCHTLEHAGAQGAIGPNLDELKPDASRVEKAVRNGIGQMPAFKSLTDQQVATLAKYVAASAGAAK